MKNSAKGRLAVIMNKKTDKMELINQATFEQERQSLLREVWRDGRFIIHESFQDIRERALNSIKE